MHTFRHFAAPVAALCLGVGIVGCSSEPRAEQVPANAQLLVQGDQMLTYTAQRDGEVYVYDSSDRKLLYSGQIQKGQSVSIDPEEDKIMIDNKLALEKDIHAGNRHRIYFVPDRTRDVERVEIRERTAADQDVDRIEVRERRASDPDSTVIKRQETKTVDTDKDGDVTIKKETTIKAD